MSVEGVVSAASEMDDVELFVVIGAVFGVLVRRHGLEWLRRGVAKAIAAIEAR